MTLPATDRAELRCVCHRVVDRRGVDTTVHDPRIVESIEGLGETCGVREEVVGFDPLSRGEPVGDRHATHPLGNRHHPVFGFVCRVHRGEM